LVRSVPIYSHRNRIREQTYEKKTPTYLRIFFILCRLILVAYFLRISAYLHISFCDNSLDLFVCDSNLQVFLCPEEEGGTGASSGETDSEQELSPIKTRVMLRLDKSSIVRTQTLSRSYHQSKHGSC
jgi:hypothetical protein